MIKRARELDLKVMIGSMNESTVGSSAVGHLLPLIDYVDMDGPLLLEEDLATGVEYNYGKVILSEEPGLGVSYSGLYTK
jgi:L-alanine-DL-glutamate epimerase-like enolase superfamily enzyme